MRVVTLAARSTSAGAVRLSASCWRERSAAGRLAATEYAPRQRRASLKKEKKMKNEYF